MANTRRIGVRRRRPDIRTQAKAPNREAAATRGAQDRFGSRLINPTIKKGSKRG